MRLIRKKPINTITEEFHDIFKMVSRLIELILEQNEHIKKISNCFVTEIRYVSEETKINEKLPEIAVFLDKHDAFITVNLIDVLLSFEGVETTINEFLVSCKIDMFRPEINVIDLSLSDFDPPIPNEKDWKEWEEKVNKFFRDLLKEGFHSYEIDNILKTEEIGLFTKRLKELAKVMVIEIPAMLEEMFKRKEESEIEQKLLEDKRNGTRKNNEAEK